MNHKKIPPNSRIYFPALLKNSSELNTVRENRAKFDYFHRMRNAAYHSGIFSLNLLKVEEAFDLCSELFNELHPSHKLLMFERALTERGVLEDLMKDHSEAKETSLRSLFATLHQKQDYEVREEPDLGAGLRPDFMARKNNHIILYEFKSAANSVTPKTLEYLIVIVDMLKDRNSDLLVEPRIVARGKFKPEIMATCTRLWNNDDR